MARKVLNGVDNNNQRLINLADPSGPTDAATKQYVDNSLSGLAWKQPVRVATTANAALATAYANGQTIDGVTLTTGMRILIKDQTTGTENGIYTVNASGAPTRAIDADALSELQNATAYVIAGTVNADKAFTQTANDPTPGTTSLVFAQVGGGTSYTAGNGLGLTSGTFSFLPKASGGLGVDGSGAFVDSTQLAALGIARKYSIDVPSGSTSAAITHSFGTKDVTVVVYDNASGAEVEADVVLTSTTVVTLTFAVAPTAGQYRVVVTG